CKNGRIGLKVGKFGGFVGCSNYPECKYTVQFECGKYKFKKFYP
ncbi:topoisomerase DNA-binding C4 zinc finger domain-containing protein, partial [Gilvibacter sp.]